MKTWIVFGDYITDAPTMVGAIQSAIVARDWIAHDLATYPAHLRARLTS